MRHFTTLALLALPLLAEAQDLSNGSNVSVSGDAEIQVTPDRVRLSFGVETRDKVLAQARARNESGVKTVLAAVASLGIDPSDMQTDFIKVDMHYQNGDGTAVDYYTVEKTIAVTLKNVSRFEDLLNAALDAGANHIYDVDFTTTELRKYRDEARALAAKAAQEKARDLAATAGMKLVEKPVGISTSSYGGGSWYGRFRNGAFVAQNVYQSAGGSSVSTGSVALGKISVTATVGMTFHLQ
jgi:uncharacterized protein YggE